MNNLLKQLFTDKLDNNVQIMGRGELLNMKSIDRVLNSNYLRQIDGDDSQ
jgi:hypothetical protein